MPLFRKIAVTIEARRFDGTQECGMQILGWMGDSRAYWASNDGGRLVIPTLDGTMEAAPEDWIIKGVKGEFYPCKPDIFAVTYEEIA